MKRSNHLTLLLNYWLPLNSRSSVRTVSSDTANRVVMNGNTVKSAGIIVIGDEILKGQTRDTNSHFFCKRLHDYGISVKRISVIPDCINTIAAEVRQFSNDFDFVFTCGGVGTTHDDMTFEGVAKAFDDNVHLNEELADILRNYFKLPVDDRSSSALKLAMVPITSELLWGTHRRTGSRSLFPIVRLRNVHVFPGVPQLCEKAFDQLEDLLFAKESNRFYSHAIFLKIDEVPIASTVESIARKYQDVVNIGSYPKLNHSYYKTKLTIESTDKDVAEAALNELTTSLKDHIVPYDRDVVANAVAKFAVYRTSLASRADCADYVAKLDQATALIERVLADYPFDSLCLSFNGGKDCTALLHLLHIKIVEKYGPDARLPAIYIAPQSVFPETEQFIHETCRRYNLSLVQLPGPIKAALTELKLSRPGIVAVFMGSRSTDPNVFHPDPLAWTDADWPRYLRAQPIIEWSYSTVWRFLRDLSIPYCRLYDRGYTSLGAKNTTGPTEALRYVDKTGVVRYHPAYMLQDESLERAGRSVPRSNV